jgi:hypothetical protein
LDQQNRAITSPKHQLTWEIRVKATIAVAMMDELGRQPKEDELNQVLLLTPHDMQHPHFRFVNQ